MNTTKKEPKHFWGFAGAHFSFFLIWALNGNLTMWLGQVAHLNGVQIGLVFTWMSAISLAFQPVFGIISDKLQFKKTLLITISSVGIFIGPFIQWLFLPLLHQSVLIGTITAATLFAFVLSAGVAVIEQYIERASLANHFEYGHSRLGGSLAGVIAALVGSRMFVWNPYSVFWAESLIALVLTLLYVFSTKVNIATDDSGTPTAEKEKINKSDVFAILKSVNFWMLSIFFVGAAAIYDVFNQQFIFYFETFFKSNADAIVMLANMSSIATGIELVLMIPMPFIIKKIGPKNGLILFAIITIIRIFGSSMATNWYQLAGLVLLSGLEMPLLLISVMEYINEAFDGKVYATVYALAFNFAKQASLAVFSMIAGCSYDNIGFKHTYIWFAGLVLVITILTFFILENTRKPGYKIKKL